jgi:4-aminobutyrate aminotransferase / (S)-3-amino-2-methylpropionate transaminase
MDEIERLDSASNVAFVGQHLYDGLAGLAREYPGRIRNLRGQGRGTFIPFGSPDRDDFLRACKAYGVNFGGSGVSAVRLRSTLTFQHHHADIFLDVIRRVLATCCR